MIRLDSTMRFFFFKDVYAYNEPSLFVMCIALKLQNIFFKYVHAYDLPLYVQWALLFLICVCFQWAFTFCHVLHILVYAYWRPKEILTTPKVGRLHYGKKGDDGQESPSGGTMGRFT